MELNKNNNDLIEYRKEKDTNKIEVISKSKKNYYKSNVSNTKSKNNVKKCDCQGLTHDVVANCIKCGKLYCSYNSELTYCDFCSGFIPDSRYPSFKSWFDNQMNSTEFAKAIEIRDRMIQHES